VPLHKWLLAARIMATENPRAITVDLLGSTLSVSYRTAWRMTQRLRAAVAATTGRSAQDAEASPPPSPSGNGGSTDAGV